MGFAGFSSAPHRRTMPRWLIVWGLLLPLTMGCAAFRPVKGLPARYVPDEYRGLTRSGKRTIDLSLLRQKPPPAHRVDSGDLLSVFIEGVLGRNVEQLPVYFPQNSEVPPSVGYPLPVREDGTISLPYVGPLAVRGLTVMDVENALRRAYTVDRQILNPGRDRIFVSLQRPRSFQVTVIRQESTSGDLSVSQGGTLNLGALKRGTGKVVTLPVYRNDVLNALAETGGLPGLDAENAIYVIRSGAQQPTALTQSQPGWSSSPASRWETASKNVPTADIVVRAQSPAWNAVDPAALQPHGDYRRGTPGQWSNAAAPTPPLAPQPDPWFAASAATPTAEAWAASAAWGYAPAMPPAIAPQPPAFTVPAPQPPAASSGFAPPQWSLPEWSPPPAYAPAPALPAWGDALHGRRIIRIPVRLGPGEVVDITEADIILHDGDIVFIESRDTEVFYTGGLLGGGQYSLPRDYDLDVLGAIAIAQGQQSGGASRGTQSIGGQSALNADVSISASQLIVLRSLPDGTQLPIRVDLYRAVRDPAERLIVQPGDYLLLQYTRAEAVCAFIERHLLEGALFGLAAAQLQTGGN